MFFCYLGACLRVFQFLVYKRNCGVSEKPFLPPRETATDFDGLNGHYKV